MEKQQRVRNTFSVCHKQPENKTLFSELLPYNSNLEYRSLRNSLDIANQTSQQKRASNVIFCSIKCKQKPVQRGSFNKENALGKLPVIKDLKKGILIDRYFNRFDIVKDRSEYRNQQNSKVRYAEYPTSRILEQAQLQDSNCRQTKYKKLQTKPNDSSNLQPAQNQLKKNKSFKLQNTLGQTNSKKNLKTARPTNIDAQMKEWALIKKKNEYEVFKLIKKNNYERMKSNMIIAQALNDLIDEREKIMAGGSDSQEFDNGEK